MSSNALDSFLSELVERIEGCAPPRSSLELVFDNARSHAFSKLGHDQSFSSLLHSSMDSSSVSSASLLCSEVDKEGAIATSPNYSPSFYRISHYEKRLSRWESIVVAPSSSMTKSPRNSGCCPTTIGSSAAAIVSPMQLPVRRSSREGIEEKSRFSTPLPFH